MSEMHAMIEHTPYHEGELAVQARVMERDRADRNGRVIAPTIPQSALGFLEHQPLVIVATVDDEDRPWASILLGKPGFARALNERSVDLRLGETSLGTPDPVQTNLGGNKTIGLLAIELSTRRRLRINGRVSARTEGALRIDVEQAYPNCPKYIQRRHPRSLRFLGQDPQTRTGQKLGNAERNMIQSSDTMFVASVHPDRGADASHRGGAAGFIRVVDARTLLIPDYAGNSMYNTFGNLHVNSRIGLAILDFSTGRIFQLTGTAEILYDEPDFEVLTGGTHRFLRIRLEHWQSWKPPVTLEWEFLDASKYNPTIRLEGGIAESVA